VIKKHRRRPPWGATKKQAEQYQRERDIKNRLFMLTQIAPANDRSLEVTQELVALFYAEDREALSPWPNDPVFAAGLHGSKPPEDDAWFSFSERYRWEAGALAAHLIAIGGQR
jgi:hypothetical protein